MIKQCSLFGMSNGAKLLKIRGVLRESIVLLLVILLHGIKNGLMLGDGVFLCPNHTRVKLKRIPVFCKPFVCSLLIT